MRVKLRRKDKLRVRLSVLCTILTLFVHDKRDPKEIGRMIGRPAYWVRRKIRMAVR
jgi:hypothetical protein